MTIHHFQPDIYYNALGSYKPVLRIADGDTVLTTTVDNRSIDRSIDTLPEIIFFVRF